MIKVFPHVKMKHHCLPVQTIVVYAVITWGFNEQEWQHTVMLPVPQHKSRRDNYANEAVSVLPSKRQIKKIHAFSQPNVHAFYQESWKKGRKTQNKFRLMTTETWPWLQKKKSSNFSGIVIILDNEAVYYGSILLSELIRQHS